MWPETEPDPVETNEPIHEWFGLSYANYLVLPRTVLQSMPVDWQRRMVGLLDECNEAIREAGLEMPRGYRVTPTDAGGRFAKEPLPHYRRAGNVLSGPAAKP